MFEKIKNKLLSFQEVVNADIMFADAMRMHDDSLAFLHDGVLKIYDLNKKTIYDTGIVMTYDRRFDIWGKRIVYNPDGVISPADHLSVFDMEKKESFSMTAMVPGGFSSFSIYENLVTGISESNTLRITRCILNGQ